MNIIHLKINRMKKLIIIGFLIVNSIIGLSQAPPLSVTIDSLRQKSDTLWFSNRKGSIVYFRTSGDTLYFGDATGEKKVSQIGTGTGDGIDSIYVAASGTWTTDSIKKDTVFNTITYQYQVADTTPIVPVVLRAGQSYWDTTNHTFTDILENNVHMQRGQEMPKHAINLTGSTIANGRIVYIVNAGGETPRIALADNRNTTAHKLIGMTTSSFTHGSTGYVTTSGKVHDLNTSGFVEGNDVYLGITGLYTQTRPTTGHIIKVGTCYYAHASNGIIDVDIQYISANGQWNVYNYNGTTGTLIDTNSVMTNSVTLQNSGATNTTVIDSSNTKIVIDPVSERVDVYNASSLLRKYNMYFDASRMPNTEYIFGGGDTLIIGWVSLDSPGILSKKDITVAGDTIFLWNKDGAQNSGIKVKNSKLYFNNTFLPFGVTWVPADIYSYSLYYDPDSLHFCWAQLKEFANDTLDRINANRGNFDTLNVTGNMLIDNFNATYSVTGDDTLGGSSAGNAIDIVTQYQWINCRTSVNTWSTYTDLNFTYDNDTIEYNGTSSTLYLTAQLSLGGATQGYEFRWYNVTDGAALPGKCKYTPAAYPTPLSFTATDVNADTNDRYVLQVRGLTATNDLLLYDGFIKITTL